MLAQNLHKESEAVNSSELAFPTSSSSCFRALHSDCSAASLEPQHRDSERRSELADLMIGIWQSITDSCESRSSCLAYCLKLEIQAERGSKGGASGWRQRRRRRGRRLLIPSSRRRCLPDFKRRSVFLRQRRASLCPEKSSAFLCVSSD